MLAIWIRREPPGSIVHAPTRAFSIANTPSTTADLVDTESVDSIELVPQHKSDLQRANAAVAAGYPAVEPVLGDLLIWLQDMNWPVAQVLAPFLATIGLPLAPHVRTILDGDDLIWKYWIVQTVLGASRPLAEAFRADIERLAHSPTKSEAHEEIDEVARDVLRTWD